MSGSFAGFSEDDIRKLSNKNPKETTQLLAAKQKPTKRPSSGSNPINSQVNNSYSNQNSDEVRNKLLNEKLQNSKSEPIPETAKLSKPAAAASDKISCDPPSNAHKPQATILTSTQYTDELRNAVKNLHTETVTENKNAETHNSYDLLKNDVATNSSENKPEVMPEKKLDLDEFQAKQKLMEEQNRKRKELLTKALAVKTKQTQEEAQKLNEIREEFKKLDALLSNDVKILRQQIEIASLDYTEAQKKYFKIEKEFLDAKMNLHQKLERKEMLTEHLCAIIEKNEERKADKLNELLLKLNLKADIQNDDTKDTVNKDDEKPNQEKNEPLPTSSTNENLATVAEE